MELGVVGVLEECLENVIYWSAFLAVFYLDFEVSLVHVSDSILGKEDIVVLQIQEVFASLSVYLRFYIGLAVVL